MGGGGGGGGGVITEGPIQLPRVLGQGAGYMIRIWQDVTKAAESLHVQMMQI